MDLSKPRRHSSQFHRIGHKGRITGVPVATNVGKDADGMDDIDEFFAAEDELLSRQRQKSQAAREKQLRYRTEPGTDITDDEGGEDDDDDDDERRGGFSADDDGAAAAAAASPAPMLEDEEEEDVGDSDLGGGDGLPDESDYDAEEVGDSGPPSALDITLVGETPGRGKGAAASSSKKKSGSTRKSLAHQRGRSSLAPQPVPMRDEGGEEEGEDGEEGVEEGGADTTRTLSKSKSRLSSAGGLRSALATPGTSKSGRRKTGSTVRFSAKPAAASTPFAGGSGASPALDMDLSFAGDASPITPMAADGSPALLSKPSSATTRGAKGTRKKGKTPASAPAQGATKHVAEQRGARTDARVSSKGLDTPASGQRSLSKSKRLSRSPTSAELARLNEDEDGDEDEMDDEGGSSSDAGAAAEVTPARSLKGAAKPTPASSSRKRKQQDDEDEDEEDEDEDEPSTPTSSKKKNIPGRRPTPDGVRRSKRHRVEPLKYWRNERIYYDLDTPEGVETPIGYTVREVFKPPPTVKIERVRKTGKKVRKALQTQDVGVDPKTPLGKMASAGVGPDSADEDDDDDPPLDAVDVIDWTAEQIDEDEPDLTSVVLAKNKAMQTWTDRDGLRICKSFGLREERWSSGLIELGAGVMKKPVNTKGNFLVFHVLAGRVKVTIHNTIISLGRGASFFVPPDNMYSLENEVERATRLNYTQVKLQNA